MRNRRSVIFLLLAVGLVLAGCGNEVNYKKAKQEAGSHTKEYLLHVSGMT